jgi:hypothetical protein
MTQTTLVATDGDLPTLLAEMLGHYAAMGVRPGRHRRLGSMDACVRCGLVGRVGRADLTFTTFDPAGVVVGCRDRVECDRRRPLALSAPPAEPMGETLSCYLRGEGR